MPPKKKAVVNQNLSESDSESVVAPIVKSTPSVKPVSTVKSMSTVKFSANDSDRLQLAQAINNFTIKGEQFITALDTLSHFGKERLTELDLNIESKKREFNDLSQQLENDFKKQQIETNQRLNEFRLKACEDIASDYQMLVVKKEAWNKQQETINNLTRELEQMKSKWNDEIETAVEKERTVQELRAQQQVTRLELTHKANVAELTAEVTQQKKEIVVLTNTIDNLKDEIAQQRQLTKEVAIASSKSQITQTIGKN